MTTLDGKILAKAAPLQALAHILPDDLVQADYAQWQQQLAAAVSAFDEGRLEQVFGQIFACYPLPVVFQDILMPLWQQLLQRQREFGQTSEWLFLDSFLRGRALQRLQLARSGGSERVLLAALPGQFGNGRGELRLGGDPARLPSTAGLRVSGRLAEFDWSAWQTALQPYQALAGDGQNRKLFAGADLRIDRFSGFGTQVDNLGVQLAPVQGGWQLDLSSALLEGRVGRVDFDLGE